jgi:hypothetical protein
LPLPVFAWNFLTLRLLPEHFSQLSRRHFLLGILSVWIVGMGRWWDDPAANLFQHLGLGSVVYVFLLAGAIWILFLPFRPARWRYTEVLTLITLTSFPAILYAIPVERFLQPQTAADLNLILLLIVALWRMAMLTLVLRRYARLSWPASLSGMLFPILTLMTLLAITSLLDRVVQTMGGVRARAPQAFGLADVLDYFFFSALASFIWYIVLIIRAHKPNLRRSARLPPGSD